MKVNADKYGKSRPKVTVDDLEGGGVIVLVVASFGEETFSDEETGTSKVTPYLTFEETGEKVHWLNKTQVRYLIDRMGEETDRWTGKPVPLERHTPEFKGKRQAEKLWVSPPESWDEIFRKAGFGRHAARPASSSATRKVVTKRAAKKRK